MAPERFEFVHRTWPAQPRELAEIRRELTRWLEPLGLTGDEIADVVLAVDEAVANAVEHAYGPERSGDVELTLWTEPGALSIEVVDHGTWRPPVEPSGPPPHGGLGFQLMHTMVGGVLIHFDERGSRVLLRYRVRDRGEPDRTTRSTATSEPGVAGRGVAPTDQG